jgi:hypothetical protein
LFFDHRVSAISNARSRASKPWFLPAALSATILILSLALTVEGAEHSAGDAKSLTFGMSTVLSGPAADLGLNMRDGVLAALEEANRVGGVRGYQLHLQPPKSVPPPKRRGWSGWSSHWRSACASARSPLSAWCCPIFTSSAPVWLAPSPRPIDSWTEWARVLPMRKTKSTTSWRFALRPTPLKTGP